MLFFLLIVTIQLLLVIAESSKSMPTYLKQISQKFLNSQNMWKYVIAFPVFMMSLSCAISSIDMLRVPVNPTNHQHDNISVSQVECSSPNKTLYSYDTYKSYSFQYLIHIWIVSIISLSAFINHTTFTRRSF